VAPTPKKSQRARRGVVIKSFQPAKVLAGFMDENHFRGFCQESLEAMTPAKQKALLTKAEAARAQVQGLPPHPDFSTEIRPLDASISDKFEKDKTFANTFANTPHRFAWINPANLVALQVFVRGEEDAVPTDDAGLVKYALPDKWSVPAEISFIPPQGPIYVVSSSPQLTMLNIRMDAKKSQIIVEPPTHINLIQVMQFNGRYYLRNGYHRVVGALIAGITELPALVIDGNQPGDVELPNMGWAGISAQFFMPRPRPPLVSDFTGSATVVIEMRERRYGASVSLQISPVNIGV
jgi:hypothetical protein